MLSHCYPSMYLLRDVQKSDLPGLKRLAAVLNTMNLPDNEETLTALIDTSVKSFSGRQPDPSRAEYLWVLEDPVTEQLVGTSMVIAQHGTYEAPHIFFEVGEREHYSASIGRHLRHTTLSIGYNYEGPTEIGGLVVDPDLRGTDLKPGKQLSYVRFLFMAMHRNLFRDRVLAELMPPLLPDGRSILWEAVGKRFTGLTYQEADRLSRQNKEFIKELFPGGEIYATLLPTRARKVLGVVGPQTRGVQKMLERIGFEYIDRIDPFDGGPHFEAELEDVTLIRDFRWATLADHALEGPKDDNDRDMLVGHSRDQGRVRFRSVRCRVRFDGRKALLPEEAVEALGARPGTELGFIPFQ